ncbi:type I-C CRISPR-associated protein Cas8c/Csd1 [Fodinisporobacter ferrooxydans]|uniref:Type I-C CRISPR-associated protein Cas8c/Csd1 n=1 Tax=Fodinisporobacter ferrooxydans TaxID=2901836 RepID=A0ABY4CQ13_9BACL|nr:type I-C CRISPR-associated protein Cas8c/Csd1 [Alicyclobacillaceae bacterium MYW30-H2]
MQKYYQYGRLFACLEVIEANGWLPSPTTLSVLYRQFEPSRFSYLLRNHRRKLNRMNSETAQILEQEMIKIFHALPVESFPIIQSFQQQKELSSGYYDQMVKLNQELVAVS